MIAGDIPDFQGLVFLLVVTTLFCIYVSWTERRAKRRLNSKINKFLDGCTENRRLKNEKTKKT